MAEISPIVPSLPCVSSFDGKHSADRAIPNLLIFIRWQTFRPSCHRRLAFLHLMANIRPTVPSLACVSSSDGKNFADRAIPNLLIFIRWQKFRPSCHHCHAFLHLMANISPRRAGRGGCCSRTAGIRRAKEPKSEGPAEQRADADFRHGKS
jgi:hypothetical protein